MSISTATIDQKYAAKGKCLMAELAIEAHTLVSNPGTVAAADAAGAAAIDALVAAGVTPVGTTATVQDGATVNVTNSAGTAVAGTETATVVAGALTVKLASTVAPVVNGVKLVLPNITGTWVNGFTFTVVAGVITAIVAS